MITNVCCSLKKTYFTNMLTSCLYNCSVKRQHFLYCTSAVYFSPALVCWSNDLSIILTLPTGLYVQYKFHHLWWMGTTTLFKNVCGDGGSCFCERLCVATPTGAVQYIPASLSSLSLVLCCSRIAQHELRGILVYLKSKPQVLTTYWGGQL